MRINLGIGSCNATYIVWLLTSPTQTIVVLIPIGQVFSSAPMVLKGRMVILKRGWREDGGKMAKLRMPRIILDHPRVIALRA